MCQASSTPSHTNTEAAWTVVLQQPGKSPTPLQAISYSARAHTHTRTLGLLPSAANPSMAAHIGTAADSAAQHQQRLSFP